MVLVCARRLFPICCRSRWGARCVYSGKYRVGLHFRVEMRRFLVSIHWSLWYSTSLHSRYRILKARAAPCCVVKFHRRYFRPLPPAPLLSWPITFPTPSPYWIRAGDLASLPFSGFEVCDKSRFTPYCASRDVCFLTPFRLSLAIFPMGGAVSLRFLVSLKSISHVFLCDS